MSLANPSAIVTGAGRGIGRAIATTLANAGVRVMAVARTDRDLASLTAEIAAAGGRCEAAVADVANEADVRRVVAAAAKQFGRIDILVNNAGMGGTASLLETGVASWDEHMAVNARGMFLFTREVAAIMIPQKSGRIVNISSIAGRRALPGFGAYSASKFAAVGFTEAIARELKAHGIAVYSLCPGAVDTELHRKAVGGEDKSPIMQPQDIAELTAFLVVGPGRALKTIAIEIA